MTFLKVVYALAAIACGIAMLVNAISMNLETMLMCILGLGFFISNFFLVGTVGLLEEKVETLEKELKKSNTDEKDENKNS